MRLTFPGALICGAAWLFSVPAAAYEPAPSVMAHLRQAQGFSGAALVATGAERPFIYLAGEARPGRAVTSRTRFDIGSIGKMLTAVAVMQLVDAGKVTLDQPIGIYLPDLPEPARAQSVASVLQHKAGFGDVLSAPGARGALNNHDYYSLVLRQQLGRPGEYAYSNSGYVVLGELIARLTGRTYEAYLKERVLEPSGMQGAGFMRADRSEDPTVAMGFISTSRGGAASISDFAAEASSQTGWMTSAAGGLYASAEDLTAFGRSLLTDRLISRVALERMCPSAPPDVPMTYGLGCMVLSDGGFGHNGERPGMEALLLMSRRAGAVVVTLSNHDQQAEPVFWPLWEAVMAEAR